jgi:hypothetical protein
MQAGARLGDTFLHQLARAFGMYVKQANAHIF